jgi:hypothetical protein
LEEVPWFCVLNDVLPPRSKEMSRAQGVVFLKRVVIKNFIEHLDWYFALYPEYKIISEVNPSRRAESIHLPAAVVQVWRDVVLLFEYRVGILLDPEDADSTIIRTAGKVSKQYMSTMLADSCQYRLWYEENDGYIHQFPKLLDGERCTTAMLLADFSHQFANAVHWGVNC